MGSKYWSVLLWIWSNVLCCVRGFLFFYFCLLSPFVRWHLTVENMCRPLICSHRINETPNCVWDYGLPFKFINHQYNCYRTSRTSHTFDLINRLDIIWIWLFPCLFFPILFLFLLLRCFKYQSQGIGNNQ